MPAPVEVARLMQAIDAFEERLPRDLPDGIVEQLGEVKKALGASEPTRDTPGSQATRQAAGTRGTGEHYSKAAQGADGPSPGQREARSISLEMLKGAGEIVGRG